MPYGYNLFPYDIKVKYEELVQIGKQCDAINTLSKHIICLSHHFSDQQMVLNALEQQRYKEPQQVFWVKLDHYATTKRFGYNNCVETTTIGFHPNRDECQWFMSNNVKERYNVIEAKSVTTLARDANNEIINKTQKPPEVAEFILGNHCKPGDTVLIIGPGAGGEIESAVALGLHVIAVEIDEKMFHGLHVRLQRLKVKEQADIEEKKLRKQKALEKEVAELQETNFGYSSSPTKGGKRKETNECPECGKAVEEGDLGKYKCVECEDGVSMHRNCLREISRGKKSVLMCAACHTVVGGAELIPDE